MRERERERENSNQSLSGIAKQMWSPAEIYHCKFVETRNVCTHMVFLIMA